VGYFPSSGSVLLDFLFTPLSVLSTGHIEALPQAKPVLHFRNPPDYNTLQDYGSLHLYKARRS
jgi:hypothetical protein